MKLELLKFIEEHDSWEEILKQKPYCLEIKHDQVFDRNLVLFKYNQIESDFSEKIVCECRGLVLDADTHEVVVFPFTKFFNFNEKHAAKIDWESACVSQKLDGSIIKIVKLGQKQLLIGTNSNIDAFKAPIADQFGCLATNFGDLVEEGLKPYDLDFETLAEKLEFGKTYLFELTSPFNQVVVRWSETRLNFIGVRDNRTFEEQKFYEHALSKIFTVPKIYDLKSEVECAAAANELPDSEEGYVVCDENFNRVKIKSPRYLELHKLAGNGVLSLERAIDIVKENEIDEVVGYFPHFKHMLDDVKDRYEDLVLDLETSWSGFMTCVTPLASRKEAAIWIKKNFKIPGVGFALLDKKVESVSEWLKDCPTKNIVKWFETIDNSQKGEMKQ